jgi:hypothetical protein
MFLRQVRGVHANRAVFFVYNKTQNGEARAARTCDCGCLNAGQFPPAAFDNGSESEARGL